MLNGLQPWHLIILVLVVVLLFGAKRLPDAARSIGKSMKIFKAETNDLRDGDKDKAAEPESKQITASEVKVETADDQVAQLQKQLDELKKQQGQSDQAHKHAS
ncbi:Sec-independent protein translocase subunit TatA [Amycolatopsis endophytica]|uniref:Sec-independent protein translocase protein TatA n=1 Tax=Amycolatopsis endophytica TaxID=860233 RepID=A0A853BBF3_9PSEU|nr:Sec-independent protein translocase subunit TatA [Amycolatopsis endophytica]NYI92082.1 sec-independent protein translocase protein TatA [Amycolatopsis endophytica]